MGWETRRGGRFYYRKERYRDATGRSRVRSIYFGSGERAEAAAREDEERRRLASVSGAEPHAAGGFDMLRPERPVSFADMLRCDGGAVDRAASEPAPSELVYVSEPAPPAITRRYRREFVPPRRYRPPRS